MEVEDEVEFTNVPEVLVEDLNKRLHHLKDDHFVFVFVHNGNEVQTGVAFVYDFELFVVDEVAHLGPAGNH